MDVQNERPWVKLDGTKDRKWTVSTSKSGLFKGSKPIRYIWTVHFHASENPSFTPWSTLSQITVYIDLRTSPLAKKTVKLS